MRRLTLASILIVLTGALIGMALTARAEPPANPAFERTWARTDQPVATGQVSRTWMWGPEAFTGSMQEPYVDSPGGQREVQYFDKSRMEINDPNADPTQLWYVTNGLLATELMTGQMQVGDDDFEAREAADVHIAGDPGATAPTYAMLGQLMDQAATPAGTTITATLVTNGTVGSEDRLTDYGVTAEYYVELTEHTVASVFSDFMNSSGLVYQDGQHVEDTLFENPFFATGFPITEAYWVYVPVAGVEQDVLVQCFERRCLTYTPANDEGWRVEAGNIGRHYYRWRYEQSDEPTPTPDPEATAAPTSTPRPDATPTPMPTPEPPPEPATEYRYQDQISDWADDLRPRAGLTVDDGGNVYVMSSYTIHKFDADGDFLRQIGEGHGFGDGNLIGPIDATIDSNGHLYVVDRGNHRIQKFTTAGHYRLQWGEHGTGSGQFDIPVGIAVDSQNQFYVVDSGNHRVQVFSDTGEYLRQWGGDGVDDGQFLSPHGVAVGQYRVEGSLGAVFEVELVFVTDIARQNVQVFTTSGSYLGQWGTYGREPGWFIRPDDIEVDSHGRIYVVDQRNHRVQKFQPTISVGTTGQLVTVRAQFLDEWGADEWGHEGNDDDGQFERPRGIGIGPDDHIYIAEAFPNFRIQMFDTGGNFLNKWSQTRGVLRWPRGLTVGNDRLFIADTGQSRMTIFDSARTFQRQVPTGETGETPFDVAIDRQGFHWVPGPNRVLKFSPDWEYITDWAYNGTFDGLSSAAADNDGNVFLVDRNNNRVVVVTSAPNVSVEYVREWGSSGNGNGEFNRPWGIAVHQDTVYVTDRGNHRVQAFDRNGNFLRAWGSNGSGEGQFSGPAGIAVDVQGYVYVADSGNHRVQKFTPEGDFLATFGAQGVNNGTFERPLGISVDPDGLVYVADSGNHRVQIFEPVQ